MATAPGALRQSSGLAHRQGPALRLLRPGRELWRRPPKLPTDELEEAEESGDVLGVRAPAGEAAGAGGSRADSEPVQSTSAALEGPLSGKTAELPPGNVQAAVAADAEEVSDAAAGDAAEPAQGAAAALAVSEGGVRSGEEGTRPAQPA